MAGETQLLELRRGYHCAAYNCAMAVISCSFSEPKFYQGFLFSEKPEKVLQCNPASNSIQKYFIDPTGCKKDPEQVLESHEKPALKPQYVTFIRKAFFFFNPFVESVSKS